MTSSSGRRSANLPQFHDVGGLFDQQALLNHYNEQKTKHSKQITKLLNSPTKNKRKRNQTEQSLEEDDNNDNHSSNNNKSNPARLANLHPEQFLNISAAKRKTKSNSSENSNTNSHWKSSDSNNNLIGRTIRYTLDPNLADPTDLNSFERIADPLSVARRLINSLDDFDAVTELASAISGLITERINQILAKQNATTQYHNNNSVQRREVELM
jgi:hypothetical protein